MLKILILGGGFGGVRCALDLDRKLGKESEITLLDRNNYHLYTPAIYEVASAFGIKRDPFAVQLRKTVCIPFADIFEGTNINFFQGEAAGLDVHSKKLITGGGHILEYDFLIIGLGAETQDHNIPGVLEYTNQFKNLGDAIFINQKLDEISEQFRNGREEPFTFLICGGGFTGIELAAEIGSCSEVIKNKYRVKGKRCSNINIIEAGPRILPSATSRERAIIKERLTDLGIMITENSPIESVGPGFIQLKNGKKMNGDVIIWTAGIRPSRFVSRIGLPLSSSGKIIVSADMSVKEYDEIFALGDSAEFTDPKNQRPVPALAYVAIDQGRIVAKNILNSLKKKKRKNYKPSYGIFILPVGARFALAHLSENWSMKGFRAWFFRCLVDIRYFLQILSPVKAFKLYFDEMTVFLKNDPGAGDGREII